MSDPRPTRREVIATGTALAATAALPARADADGSELTFFTLGDWGRRGDASQRLVAAAMETWRDRLKPRFIMTVGDNFYPVGQDWPFWKHWDSSFTCVYSEALRGIPWVPALGNHDYWGSLDDQIRHHRAHNWEGQGRRYYPYRPQTSHGGRTVDIFVLDTSPLQELYFGSVGGRAVQRRWLETELAASKADWKLVFGHHAVLSGGQHGRSPRLANWLQGLLEDHGVQAYVCGHDHDLQHIVAGETKAPHYILTGAGSKCDRRVVEFDGTWFSQAKRPGFTIFQIFGDTMCVDFIDAADPLKVAHRAEVPLIPADAPAKGATWGGKGKPAHQPRIAGKRPEGVVHPDDIAKEPKAPGEPRPKQQCEVAPLRSA